MLVQLNVILIHTAFAYGEYKSIQLFRSDASC